MKVKTQIGELPVKILAMSTVCRLEKIQLEDGPRGEP